MSETLTADQRTRVDALHAAREVLAQRGFASSRVDAMELHNIAEYIVTGKDPWELLPVVGRGRWLRRRKAADAS